MGCDGNVRSCVIADDVSIHAPAWGATVGVFSFFLNSQFQSTHPHGVRPRIRVFRIRINRFNPRTRMGCDTVRRINSISRSSFQSTHPHGVRPGATHDCNSPCKFQSTHPHGVRLPHRTSTYSEPLFQSTHPHGVRPLVLSIALSRKVSIHAPAWGATIVIFIKYQRRIVSIHAPAWGATTMIGSIIGGAMFQSTHPHGVRHCGNNNIVRQR